LKQAAKVEKIYSSKELKPELIKAQIFKPMFGREPTEVADKHNIGRFKRCFWQRH
jgi:hypothetical protein